MRFSDENTHISRAKLLKKNQLYMLAVHQSESLKQVMLLLADCILYVCLDYIYSHMTHSETWLSWRRYPNFSAIGKYFRTHWFLSLSAISTHRLPMIELWLRKLQVKNIIWLSSVSSCNCYILMHSDRANCRLDKEWYLCRTTCTAVHFNTVSFLTNIHRNTP